MFFCDNITVSSKIWLLKNEICHLKVSEGENLENLKNWRIWSFSQENNLLLSRSSHNLELHVHANKTYWISSHGLGSPKTLLRDCSLGDVRRNPGGGVRDNRNFISASPSPPSPKPQKSMYLPMCVDFEGRFQILAGICTYIVFWIFSVLSCHHNSSVH